MTIFITQSEMQTYMRCKRKWWLSVYRALKLTDTKPVGALALGTNVHDALADHYARRGDALTSFDRNYAGIMANLPEEDLDLASRVADDHKLGRLMIEGYLQWVMEEGVDVHLDVVSVEQKVDVPTHRDDVRLLGKLDLRVTDVHGARWFLDHKTTGSLTEPLKTLHMDFQMLMYHLLEYLKAVEEGLDPTSGEVHCAGGMYNMLRKVQRTARAKPPFYGRVDFTHGIIELRSFYTRVIGTVNDIMMTRQALDEGQDHHLVAYPTPSGRCSWDCEWRRVCPMFDDGSDHARWIADFAVGYDPLERYTERTDEA